MSCIIKVKEEKEKEEVPNKKIQQYLKENNLNPKNPKDLQYLLSLIMGAKIKDLNYEKILNYLMNNFNNKNKYEKIYYDFFFQSCKLGKISIVKILLKNGLNVNFQNESGETPLHVAVKKNDLELIKLLISYEPDLSLSSKKEGLTALNYAEIYGNKKIIKMIKELNEKNKRKIIKSEIVNFINMDMNNINNISGDNISYLVNKSENFDEIKNYTGEKVSLITEEETKNKMRKSNKKIKIKNINKNVNKNDINNEITQKILNYSDYNEDIPPKNTIKVIDYYINSNHSIILKNNYNNQRICNTEENNLEAKLSKHLTSDMKYFSSSLKRKDELFNYNLFHRSINPSCVQSLTTTHTYNRELMESPLLRYKSVRPINAKEEIFKFILEINLPSNYAKLLIENGFDDLEMLISQSKNNIALSNQNLKDIGIKLPGDRAKILIHLEELSGNYPFYLEREKIYSNTFGQKSNNSLYIFLSSINLDEYIKTFNDKGYYNAELLYVQMRSKSKITEEILKTDFGITKIGHTKRIMLNLMTSSEFYIKKMQKKDDKNDNEEINSIESEGNPYLNKCDSICMAF